MLDKTLKAALIILALLFCWLGVKHLDSYRVGTYQFVYMGAGVCAMDTRSGTLYMWERPSNQWVKMQSIE